MADLAYTTVQRFKDEGGSVTNNVPAIIEALIGAASRAIDRKATGANDNSAINYFRLETVTDEQIFGQVDAHGVIVTAPRKPSITAVTALSYRTSPATSWQSADASLIWVDGGQLIRAYVTSHLLTQMPIGRVMLKITYTGGLAATTEDLPDDLQEIATILAIRYAREAQTGMSDAMGVAELVGSNLFYTKAWPQRALDMLQPFMRRVSWRGIS